MIPHFTLQKGKQEYLIIRMGDEFHIIDINEALTKEKRTAVLESGCTPAQMREMGLSGTTIPRSDIEAITVTGCSFQDEVIFYLGKRKKLGYWFPKAYEQKKVDDFFRGIPRKQYKTRYRLKGGKGQDWHVREQEPEVRKRLKVVGIALKILAGLTAVGMLWRPGWMALWLGLGIFSALSAVVLTVVFEPYFTFMPTEEYRKAGYKGEIITLTIMPFLPLGILFLTADRYTVLGRDLRLIYGLAVGVLMFGVLWFCLRELRENPGHGFAVFFVTVVLTACTATHINHYFAAEPMTESVAQVENKDRHRSRRSSDHDLFVVLEDGTRLQLDVSRAAYDDTEIGDTVIVQSRVGALGVEYAMFGGFAE